jgi:hypothetical protein
MTPNYSSMWANLGRAKELLLGIDGEVKAWMDTAPYGYIIKVNEDKSCVSIIIKVKNEPPLVRWSLILADFFHNLRCVLDHMVWAIAVHENPGFSSMNNTTLQFPIWNNAPTLRDWGKNALLSDPVRTAIELVQPYKALPDPVLPMHPLAILGWLDNTNKHRLLKMAQGSAGAGDVRITWQGTNDPPERRIHTGDIKDGTEVLRFTFPAPQLNVECEVKSLSAIIAIVYPKATPRGTDRDDYAALGDILIEKVKCVISVVTAAVP